jgi:hemerythrin-like domain-containing protein
MQARGPLMIEHRLIEKMLKIIRRELQQIRMTNRVDPLIIDKVVDFVRIYADRTHHGKEEGILFKQLDNKNISDQDKRLMEELINEHLLGRKTTKELIEANSRYRNGNHLALSIIAAKLDLLVDFYPKHIEKEDKIFFPAYAKYFTEQEDQAMLNQFWEFDQKMIHEKYKSVVQEMNE